jgi:Rad3-related DNA helicase
VEFIARSGDIDSRYTAGVKAAEGSRIHRLLQREGGDNYRTEVVLSTTETIGAVQFTVSGRADGVIDAAPPVIDEIKSTMRRVGGIREDDYPVHWAQAMCYGHIYCAENQIDTLAVRLTYCQADTGELQRFTRFYTANELRAYFLALLEKYVPWAIYERDWRETSRASMQALGFPFGGYREGQRRFAAAVYRTIADGGRLYASAPTGIGKTMSALFPAVKSLGEGLSERVFYLTAKTAQRAAATDAVRRLTERGLRAKTVVLTAKDKICPHAERVCDPEKCKFADGHFDRVNDAIFDALQSRDLFTRDEIESAAEKHNVCPFELSLDLALWADIIICDYNYVFDPRAYLRRFFADGGGEFVFLVDEAHNLVERAREMFSAEVTKREFLDAKKSVAKSHKSLRRSLNSLNTHFLALRTELGDAGLNVSPERDAALDDLLDRFIMEVGDFLPQNPDAPKPLLEAYWDALAFRQLAEDYDECYVSLSRASETDVSVKLFCADPATRLSECFTRGRAAILFSATLLPVGYYATVLGGDDNSKTLTLPSPFPRENLLLLVDGGVSTRFADRAATADEIADLIHAAVSARRGSYMAFFPSYQYMDAVYASFSARYGDINTVKQSYGMDETARDAFVAGFDGGAERVGFCVLGGVFAEGIDLRGDRLIGAIIVSVGLARLNTESDVVRAGYETRYGAGYDFAYRFPGMNKVLQAAGRVVRSEEERGVVLLIDDRFTTARYQALFPEHWTGWRRVRGAEEIKTLAEDFWND